MLSLVGFQFFSYTDLAFIIIQRKVRETLLFLFTFAQHVGKSSLSIGLALLAPPIFTKQFQLINYKSYTQRLNSSKLKTPLCFSSFCSYLIFSSAIPFKKSFFHKRYLRKCIIKLAVLNKITIRRFPQHVSGYR